MSALRLAPAPIILRRLVVLETVAITDRMLRVVLGGPELGAFGRDGMDFPAFASPAFDDHVKLIFAPGGDLADALPVQRANGIEWTPSQSRETRDYTPVELGPESVAFDFVIHSAGDAADRGPAELWATAAQTGDPLWIVGPKSSTIVPDGVDWTLLVGDETALPAVRRFFAERPVTGPVRAVLTVSDDAARQDLATRPGDDVTWVIAEPGDRKALADALASVDRPAGRPYVWAAAESRALLPVRKFVKRELGADKSTSDITGYWHLRAVEAEPVRDGNGAEAPAARVNLVGSPVTWFAVRAALQLGILDAVDGGARDVDALATAVGVDPGRLASLVDLLVACRVLTRAGGVLALDAVGDELLTDEHLRERFDGPDADLALMLDDLAGSLRAGEPAWRRRTGRTYAEHVHADAENYREFAEEAASLTFLVPALAQLPGGWAGKLAFFGPGAVVVADGLIRAEAIAVDTELVMVASGEPAGALASTSTTGRVTFAEAEAAADHDTVVGAYALDYRDDAEALAALTDLGGRARRLVIVEEVAADALSPTFLEQSLVAATVVGRPRRGIAELGDLARRAGWQLVESVALGWGAAALICEPASSAVRSPE